MKLKIAENLKKYRLENNMTQERLAEKLGVSFQATACRICGLTVSCRNPIVLSARVHGGYGKSS